MKKIFSIFLSVLLLASTTGIGYAQHFCGGKKMLSEITLLSKDLSCGMEMEKPSDNATAHLTEDHCCENIVAHVKTDTNFAKASFELDFQKVFIASFVTVFVLQQVEIPSHRDDYFAVYNPPPIDKDIPVLYQTFLI